MTMDIQKLGRGDQSTPDLKAPQQGAVDEPEGLDCRARAEAQYGVCQGRSAKRSFDVAFLMMPDEKMKQKQLEKQLRMSKHIFAEGHCASLRREADGFGRGPERARGSRETDDLKVTDLSTSTCYADRYRRRDDSASPSDQDHNIDVGTDEFATKSVLSDSDVSDMSRSRPDSAESFSRPVRVVHESPYRNKVFDDPSLISQARSACDLDKYAPRFPDSAPRSAFTKVSNSHQNGAPAASPEHSESPDNLSYQNSLSPPLAASSPPAINALFSKSPPFKSLIPPNHPFLSSSHAFFKSQNLHTYQSHFAAEQNHPTSPESPHFRKSSPPNYAAMEKSESEKHLHFAHSNAKFGHLLPFRPEMSPYLQTGGSPYGFPVQNFHHHGAEFLKFPQQTEMIRNPAAAILSTLLPPTLATLSLPAQNVCAKCNISFRMTSDLVYHMRSHHKSEVAYDASRRKREDKLKCPVCAESFRERHHLTRHMTAHQDKEGDILDQQIDPVESNASGFCSKSKNRPYYGLTNGLHQK